MLVFVVLSADGWTCSFLVCQCGVPKNLSAAVDTVHVFVYALGCRNVYSYSAVSSHS
jgi:hypothetical protein